MEHSLQLCSWLQYVCGTWNSPRARVIFWTAFGKVGAVEMTLANMES